MFCVVATSAQFTSKFRCEIFTQDPHFKDALFADQGKKYSHCMDKRKQHMFHLSKSGINNIQSSDTDVIIFLSLKKYCIMSSRPLHPSTNYVRPQQSYIFKRQLRLYIYEPGQPQTKHDRAYHDGDSSIPAAFGPGHLPRYYTASMSSSCQILSLNAAQ